LTDEERRAQEKKLMAEAEAAMQAKKEAAYLGIDVKEVERKKWAEEVINFISNFKMPNATVSLNFS
jgi:hypothetical protein